MSVKTRKEFNGKKHITVSSALCVFPFSYVDIYIIRVCSQELL